MVITIKDEENRFGVRVAAIIYNKDMTKIFLQKQGKHDFYMFPGGRLELHEDAESAIRRELKEELNIEEDVSLKYVSENFIAFPSKKYHEIGFYFILKIDEEKYNYFPGEEYDSKDEENDGKSKFKWVDAKEINEISLMPDIMKNKLFTDKFDNLDTIEHIVYREYE